MKGTIVSAVIITHNRQELLRRAIESVLNQTYKEIECIVVDDASTDGTSEVCSSYPVQYLFISKNESRGGNYARNLGIKAAKGEYIALLDDDDYWLPEKTEKQLALIKENENELVYCGKIMEIISEKGVSYYNGFLNPSFQGYMGKKILQTVCCCTSSTMMISKKALYEVGLFDENLAFWQDYELTIRLAQRKPFYFVNEYLCVYRKDTIDPQRLTNKYFGWKKAVRYINEKHADLYKELSHKERLFAKVVVWEDAIKRCKAGGLRWRYWYYRILYALFWSVPQRIQKHF